MSKNPAAAATPADAETQESSTVKARTAPAPASRPALRLPNATVTFTTRQGGVSEGPYESLNLGILTADDPELHRFPIAYLSEPGFWSLSEAETMGLRTYLQKGGFLIFDDFFGEHWFNFESQMLKVLPQARLVRLDTSHPIFDSFFHITSLDYRHPYFGHPSEFYGIFEDNDPSKRLMVIVNYNNDIGDYWEWSAEGLYGDAPTADAYRLGVDYLVYAMTH